VEAIMKIRRVCLIVVVGALMAGVSYGDCLFVNASTTPNSVAAFQVGAGGTLALAPGSPFATNGGGQGHGIITVGTRLYVANTSYNSGGSISGFTIAPDCSLTLLPGSPYASGDSTSGLGAGADRLFAGGFNDAEVWVYDIAVNGSLSPVTGTPSSTPSNPLEFEVDGDHIFVSHLFSGVGSYYVSSGGSLAPASGSPYTSGPSEPGMRGTALTASGGRLYVADSQQDRVAVYSVSGTLVLSHITGSPFSVLTNPTDVLLSPADDRLFVSGYGGDIGVYNLDGTGALTAVAGSPFTTGGGSALDSLARDPSGTYLYTASGFEAATDEVYAFSVAANGTLTALSGSPFAMGTTGNPGWLTYYAGEGEIVGAAIPALAPAGLAVLLLLLAGLSLAVLRRA